MFSERINRYLITATIILACCGCSNISKEQRAAGELLDQATQSYEDGDYSQAIAMIDEIDSVYSAQVDIRRKAMELRPQVEGKLMEQRLAEIDMQLAENQREGDSLRTLITNVPNPVENYFMALPVEEKDVRHVSGLHSRVSPQFSFYMIATTTKPVKTTSVGLRSKSGREVWTTEIPFDSERNERFGSTEMITMTELECDTLARFAVEHADEELTILFKGSNGTSQQAMTGYQKNSLLTLYRWVQAIRRDKQLRIESEKIERRLDLSRHLADSLSTR